MRKYNAADAAGPERRTAMDEHLPGEPHGLGLSGVDVRKLRPASIGLRNPTPDVEVVSGHGKLLQKAEAPRITQVTEAWARLPKSVPDGNRIVLVRAPPIIKNRNPVDPSNSRRHATNLLTRKLEAVGPLPEEDKALLDDVINESRYVPARTDLISEGDVPQDVNLILEGFACRYKILQNGRRQIMAYLVPGDFCDIHVFLLEHMDHNIGTLSPCRVVGISRKRVLELTERPAIARAMWWAAMVDGATLREWLVNLGQRNAPHRIAHLLCELLLRLQNVGENDGDSFTLPITQSELGDTMGLSTVHVNRSLQALRDERLIIFRRSQIVIPDLPRLIKFSDFNPNYLHLRPANSQKS